MSRKNVEKNILLLITSGNLNEVLKLIETNKDLWKDEFFVNVACYCTKIKNIQSVNEEYLLELLVFCSEKINHLQEKQWDVYLKSIYHVTKNIYQHFDVPDVEKLEKFLIPHFWDNLTETKFKSLYNSLCNSTHNKFSKITKIYANSSDFNERILWCNLCLRMYHKILSIEELFETKVNVYFKYLLVAPIENQLSFFNSVLKVLEFNQKISAERVSILLLKTLKRLSDKINNMNNIELNTFKDCIRKIVQITSKLSEKNTADKSALLLSLSDLIVIENEADEKLSKFYHNFRNLDSKEFFYSQEILYVIKNILNNSIKSEKFISSNNSLTCYTHLVFMLSKEISNSNKKCSFCQNCSACTDIYTSVRFLSKMIQVVTESILKKVETKEELLNEVLYYTRFACDLIWRLQKQLCETWTQVWLKLGVNIYNIGVNLHPKKPEISFLFWKLLVEKILEFQQENIVISNEVLNSALNSMINFCMNNKNYKDAQNYIALNAWKGPQNKLKNVYYRWMNIKILCKDDEALKETTIASVLKDNCQYGHFLTSSEHEMLLIYELEYYKMLWPSKISMLSALKELTEVADISTTAKVITKIWGDFKTPMHENFCFIFRKVMNQLEKEKYNLGTEIRLCMSNLYVLDFDIELAELRKKHQDKMKNVVDVSKSPLPPHEIPPNPNDECDMVSAYSNLNVDTIQQIIRKLDVALKELKMIDFSKLDPNIIDKYKIYDLLFVMFKHYQLHKYASAAVQCLTLNINIAKLTNNKINELKSIVLILEITDVNCMNNNQLLKEAEGIVNDLQQLKNEKNVKELLVMYYIQRSQNYLRTKDVLKALSDFELIEELSKDVSDLVIMSKKRLLKFELLLLPCKYNVKDHGVSPVVELHQQLQAVSSHVKENPTDIGPLNMYFILIKNIATLYRWMRLPREMRCYAKDAAVLAQTLLLPLLSVEFLTLLSYADVMSTRYDDCSVKLEGISNSLCMNFNNIKHSSTLEVPKFSEIVAQPMLENSKKNIEVPELREQVLDIPASAPCRSTIAGSPEFTQKNFTLPTFLRHKNSCECVYCVNVEYHISTIKTLHLYAQLNFCKENYTLAKQFFEGTKLYFEKLRELEVNIINKLNENIGSDLLFESETCYWEAYASVLLDFAFFLMKINNNNEAKKMNDKVLDFLHGKELKNTYLFNEAQLQRCYIVMNNQKRKSTLIVENNENYCEINSVDKTPENKQSKVKLIKSKSPKVILPRTPNMKVLKLSFDEDKKKICKSSCKKVETNIIKTPELIINKVEENTCKKITQIRVPDDSDVITKTPDVSPVAVKRTDATSHRALRSNTRLLTDKLKTSIKKPVEHLDKAGIRKNLLAELNEVVTDFDNLTVSDHSRNEKKVKKTNLVKKGKKTLKKV